MKKRTCLCFAINSDSTKDYNDKEGYMMSFKQLPLLEFMKGKDKRVIIPSFHRRYVWDEEQCKRLFDDIVSMVQQGTDAHFLGTVEYLYDRHASNNDYKIIDGNQRITTITLLLLAMSHEEEEGHNSRSVNAFQISDSYLIANYNANNKLKLCLNDGDDVALQAIYSRKRSGLKNSNISDNYLFFREEIRRAPIDLARLLGGLKKLNIFTIRLKNDNPEFLFEDIKGNGYGLTEAEKFRNLLFKYLESVGTREYHKTYWNKIEVLTQKRISDYIRYYLAYKKRLVPKRYDIYATFKDFIIQSLRDDKLEKMISELLQFARFFKDINEQKPNSTNIGNTLKEMSASDNAVEFPFLIEVFYDSYTEKIVHKDKLQEILEAAD